MNTYLVNRSGTVAYCAVQGNKGRVIVIDNELQEGMIINRKMAIAHTPNIKLRRPFGGIPAFEILGGMALGTQNE